MATRIAECITRKLLASSVIKEEDRALYNYGFFLLITHFLFFVITVLVGFLFSVPSESVLFYIVFMFLRTYAGGVHARTERACTFLTALALTTSVFGISIMDHLDSKTIPMTLFAGGSLCVILCSPLNSREKPLNNSEKKRYRAICCGIIMLCIASVFALHALSLNRFISSIICAVSLESLLLIAGLIFN